MNWQVLQENDVDSFVVEGSFDAHNFYPVGKLASLGNASFTRVYNYIVHDPDPGMIFFRIRAANELGKSGISNEVRVTETVDYDGGDYIYPTVASSEIFLVHYSSSHYASIIITSSSGKTVQREQVWLNAGNVKRTNVSHLASGIYFFTVENSGYRKTWQFMKN